MPAHFALAGFVLSPTGLLLVLVLVSISIGILLAEFTGQSWIALHAAAGRRVTVLDTVVEVLRRFPQLWLLGTRTFLRLLLLAAVLALGYLLHRKDFVDQVVITSLDAAALAQIKAMEPRLKTGLIVTAAVGDVTRTPADFVSLNMARATASLVRRAHDAGKDVHVWTVNTPDAMLAMIERGVDNIITDDPAVLVGVLRKRDALSHGEKLALRLRILFVRPPREATDRAAVRAL